MTDSDGGALSFKSVMDNDPMNAAIEETLRRIQGLSDGTLAGGEKINAAFRQTAGNIHRAFQTIDQTAGEHQAALQALEAEYDRLGQETERASHAGIKTINDAIIEETRKSSGLFVRLFEDASQKSLNEIRRIKAETENLYDYLKGQESATKPIGFTGEELEAMKKDPKVVEALQKAIGKLKKEISGRSSFAQFADDVKKAVAQMKAGDITGGLESIGRAANNITPQIKSLGNDLATIFGDNQLGGEIELAMDALEGLGATATGVGQIMAGNIAGGVQNLVSGASKLISVFHSLNDQENANLQKRIEHYGRLIALYDRLIGKQKDLLGSLSGTEAIEASQKAAGLIDEQTSVERKKIEAWFKQKNGHSNAYKFNQSWVNFTDKDVLAYKAEDWEKLREHVELWDRLPKEVQDYGTAVMEAKEKTAELAEATQEAVAGFSFDSFSQSFLNTLMNMDSSVEDFAGNMEKNLQKAILDSLMDEKYKDRIKQLYNDFAEYNTNGITEEEAARLRKANDDLAAQLIADRENLARSFGWNVSEAPDADASLTGAVKGVSEETASKVAGQMNAIRINQLEATEMLRQQLFHLANIDRNTVSIDGNTQYIKSIYDKMTSLGDSLRSQGLG
ncbi:MAG: hypothetical protein EZS26_002938 [Candidatus Ordinivivax streblomastigis]|uniref:Uncharacterized protein n=1 Tax=Candidatus Ordinivivax streblomastigis TaxID=2540710 RepID=A0A5M8NVM6_9BACT|nr:MAG: hypothetical protein EZS26_002938 [Candidatus Ordinivivax streblomastigis]